MYRKKSYFMVGTIKLPLLDLGFAFPNLQYIKFLCNNNY